MSGNSMIATMPLAMATGSVSGRIVALNWSVGSPSDRITQLGEGRNLEHPAGRLGFESGAQAAGQRVPIPDVSDGAEEMTGAIPGARAGNRGR